MFSLLQKTTMPQPSGDALRASTEVAPSLTWHKILAWFARFLSLIWLMKGLAAWATIFGVLGRGNEFLLRDVDFQSTVVFFAVIDVIAAVGLWTLSAWGGVVWLVAVLSYICVATLFNNLVTLGAWSAWLFAVLLIAYFILAWRAARERLP